MTDALAIAAINREQLATATDRLLMRGSRPRLRRTHNGQRAASSRLSVAAPLRGSLPSIVLPAAVTHAPTIFGAGSYAAPRSAAKLPRARGRSGFVRALLALGVTIPTAVGIGLAVAAFC